MIIRMYNNSSDSNVMIKTLNNMVEYPVKIKGTIDIIRPTIQMQIKEKFIYNYCYIPDFNRYYYIDSIEVFPNNLYELRLRCDVLMSFKDSIIGSVCLVSKKVGDSYIGNGESEVRKDFNIYESNIKINETETFILVTLGGVK
ncbi:MAG: hypothetical protein ACRCSJ_06600 [Cetobacterium sp.]